MKLTDKEQIKLLKARIRDFEGRVKQEVKHEKEKKRGKRESMPVDKKKVCVKHKNTSITIEISDSS